MLLKTLAGPGSNLPGWREDVAQQLGRYPYITGTCALLLVLVAAIALFRSRRSALPAWRRSAVIVPILLAIGPLVLAQHAWSIYSVYTSPDGLRQFDGGTFSDTLQMLDSFTLLTIVVTLAWLFAFGVYMFVLADQD